MAASILSAPLAQLDRVIGFEPIGREFESLRAHQFFRSNRRPKGSNLLEKFSTKKLSQAGSEHCL